MPRFSPHWSILMCDSPVTVPLIWILLGIFQGWCVVAGGQTPAYLHYDVSDGLPSNLVYCGLQDRRGLMWFGTDKGLASFDGARFRVYGTKDGLPDPDILNIYEDSQQRLWISNFRQQPCYRQGGQFVTANDNKLLEKLSQAKSAFTFFESRDNDLRIAGLLSDVVITNGENVWTEHYPDAVARFAYIEDYLFALTTRMIVERQADGNHTIHYTFKPFSKAYCGSNISGNRLLYALSEGLILFEWRNGQMHKLMELHGNLTGQVFTDSQGRFWICSKEVGAVCFDNDQRDLSNPVIHLKGKKVTAMAEDSQGTLWFCTAGDGIYALPHRTAAYFSRTDGFVSDNITALNISKDGQIWVGDDEGNIYVLTQEKPINIVSTNLDKGYNRCRQLLEAPNGDYWIVTDKNLSVFDGKCINIAIPTLSAFKAVVWHADRLWYICFSNLGYLFPDDHNRSFRYHHRRFTSFGLDSNKQLWVGRPDGLFFGPDSLAYNWGDKFPELKNRIVAIQAADANHLWVVTPTQGLLRVAIHDGTVQGVEIANRHFSKPVSGIQSLYVAPNGKLWMATNAGVYGLSADWTLQHFDSNSGLAADDVNAVAVQGDTLWAATVSGLSRLILQPLSRIGDFPTLITGLRYRQDGQAHYLNLLDSTMITPSVTLPADATLAEFDLTALDFSSRGNLQYECLFYQELLPWYYWTPGNLIGWAEQWFQGEADTTRLDKNTLSLGVQLAPGNYRFQLTAISGTGVQSRYPAEWQLQMTPRWYYTIWAILALWLLMAWSIWRYLRARSEMSVTVAQLRLTALQSQINPHFIGNSINAIQQFFYPFNAGKASTYIALFTRLLRQTIGFTENTFIPLKEEITYVRNYLKMVEMRFGSHFRFEITGVESIPPDLLFPVMLLQPLLENATIHGQAPEGQSVLQLDFQYSGNRLSCTLLDNGLGIKQTTNRKKGASQPHKSRGLEMVAKKAQVLNQLYRNLSLQYVLQDRSEDYPAARGTRVTIIFAPPKSA